VRGRRIVAVVGSLLTGFLLPGVGHAWIGRFWRGIAWALLGTAARLGVVLSVWFVPAWIAIVLLATIDLTLIRVEDAPRERRVVVALAMIGAGVASMFVIRAFVAQAHKIPSSGMSPTLVIGDYVMSDKTGIHPIARGDVIVYAHPCDTRKDFVKRVVALAGDTIEVRCTVLYVNGEAVPRELVEAADAYEDLDDSSGQWSRVTVSRWRERLDGAAFDIYLDADQATPSGEPDTHDFPTEERVPVCPGVSDRPAIPDAAVGEVDPAAPCTPGLHYQVPPGHVFVMGDNRNNSHDARFTGPVPTRLIKGRVTGIWWSSSEDAGVRWSRVGDL
jgi:signal peptidase I